METLCPYPVIKNMGRKSAQLWPQMRKTVQYPLFLHIRAVGDFLDSVQQQRLYELTN